MNKKIVCLGGGSWYFRGALGDVAVMEGLRGSEITLYDLDYEKSETMAEYGSRLTEKAGTGMPYSTAMATVFRHAACVFSITFLK